MTDKKIVDEAFWAFIDATNTKTAGGGKQGYRHMLERVAATMANDHGNRSVAEAFAAIANQYADYGGP